MTPSQRQFIRDNLLQQLAEIRPTAAPGETLLYGLRQAGFTLERPALDAELAYLRDKELIAAERAELSAAILRHRITAKGTDYLEAQGLL